MGMKIWLRFKPVTFHHKVFWNMIIATRAFEEATWQNSKS